MKYIIFVKIEGEDEIQVFEITDNWVEGKLNSSTIYGNIKIGETLRLLVEERGLYCDVFIEDIEYGDGTIWVKYLGDNE